MFRTGPSPEPPGQERFDLSIAEIRMPSSQVRSHHRDAEFVQL
jgi:hypothetical protein